MFTSCRAEFTDHVTDVQQPLEKIVTTLAEEKAFRTKTADFERLIEPYCKRTYSDIDEIDTLAQYACDKDTGISKIKLDERKDVKQGGNFIMYISMDISVDAYASFRSLGEKKRGKPSKSGKDYVTWNYTQDKKLHSIGNPVLHLSRNTSGNKTSLNLAIEQGL